MSASTVFYASHAGLDVICGVTAKFKACPCRTLVSGPEEFVYEVSVEADAVEAVKAALEKARVGDVLAIESQTKRYVIGSSMSSREFCDREGNVLASGDKVIADVGMWRGYSGRVVLVAHIAEVLFDTDQNGMKLREPFTYRTTTYDLLRCNGHD